MKTEKEISRLIDSVGTNTFIEYFFEFKNLNKKILVNLFKLNNEKWKESSYKLKANVGKRIFKEKREIEALNHIIITKKTAHILNGVFIKQKAKIYYEALK